MIEDIINILSKIKDKFDSQVFIKILLIYSIIPIKFIKLFCKFINNIIYINIYLRIIIYFKDKHIYLRIIIYFKDKHIY